MPVRSCSKPPFPSMTTIRRNLSRRGSSKRSTGSIRKPFRSCYVETIASWDGGSRLSRALPAPAAENQKLRKLHGRTRTRLHLALDSLLILAQRFRAVPPLQLTLFDVQKNLDFPSLKVVPVDRPP